MPGAEIAASAGNRDTATDYPSPQSALANQRRDNQRRLRWDPKPNRSGPPAQCSKATRQRSRFEPNAAGPIRSTGENDQVLGASCRASPANPDRCQPAPARFRPPGRAQVALPSIPPD
jgi:hypothetical protein